MKTILLGIGGLLLAVILILFGLIGWRAVQQQAVARELRIATPDGIEEAGFVQIGGVDQWVQIRGEHRSNPIVLVVHGGPGFAMAPLTPVFRDWEHDFTVVQWDQRDAGRTYSRNGPLSLTLDQSARDGIAVSEYLRRRLGSPRIILLGHSWGSAVGLNMILRRPDLFSAFVGTGQMVSKREQESISYATVLARVRAAGDRKAVGELEQAGPPPYKNLSKLLVQRKWLASVDTPAERDLFKRMVPILAFAPGQSFREIWDYLAAPKYAQQISFDEIAGFEARPLGLSFGVPVFIFEGDQDLYTPPGPSRRYLSEINAPDKGFVTLSGGGHNAMLTMPKAFLAALVLHVRPLAFAPASH